MPRLEVVSKTLHVVSLKRDSFEIYTRLGKNRVKGVKVSGETIDIPITDFVSLDTSGNAPRLSYFNRYPISGLNTEFKIKGHAVPELRTVVGKNVKLLINTRNHKYYED